MRKRHFLLIVITLVAVLASTTIANATTVRQDQAHNLADGARAMGFGEDTAVVKVMQDLWSLENGDNSAKDSYYYSSRTGKYYKLVPTGYYNNSSNYYGGYDYGINDTAIDHFDGTYYWYLDKSTGYYYRYDKYGNKKTGAKAPNYNGNYYNGNYYNNNYYNNQKFWSGIITDVEGRVSSSDAEAVAKFILSYDGMTDGTTRQRAELAWCLLNNGGSISNALRNFEDYNPRIDLSTNQGQEALRIARDVLYRRYIENRDGNRNVGRVLPSNYSWMWIENGQVYLRASRNGTNWDHSLASPY